MSFQVIWGRKGSVLLVVNGHKFSFQTTSARGVQRWGCTLRKTRCKAFIKINGEENVIVDSLLNHNHNKLPSPVLKLKQLTNKLKRKAQDNLSERPSIIHKELKSWDVDTVTIVPSDESVVVLSEQSSDQSTSSTIQTNSANDSTEMNNEEILQANRTKKRIGFANQGNGKLVANFGWEQIENGPLLPFIKRGSENLVAWHIVVEKVCKNITSVFSLEMLTCISILVLPMWESEARAYNEINKEHCDRTLVGTYVFTKGDATVSLEDVKKLIQYFHACRNLVLCGEKNTGLFGFIRINGQTEVPFVWEGNHRLVPLFYFEGIEAKVINLVDHWKICYLKFCFKMQQIRQELYQQTIKVVDFKDVEALFSAGSTFEPCLLNNINQELLAPEMRTVLPAASALRKRPAEASAEIEAKKARICVTNSQLASETSLIHPNQTQTANQLKRPELVTVDARSMRSPQESQNITLTPVNYQASTPQIRFKSTKHLQDVSGTAIPHQEGSQQESNTQFVTADGQSFVYPQKSQDVTTASVNCQTSSQEINFKSARRRQDLATITPVPHQEGPVWDYNIRRVKLGIEQLATNTQVPHEEGPQRDSPIRGINPRLKQLTTSTRISAPIQTTRNVQQSFNDMRPIEEYRITNVPRRSPQVSSSPEMRQTSPFVTTASETVQGHSQGNNLVTTGIQSETHRQTYMSNNKYPPEYREQYRNQQMSGGYNVEDSLGSPSVIVQNSDLQQSNFKGQNSTAPLLQFKFKKSKPQTVSTQVDQFSPMPHDTALNKYLCNSSLASGVNQQPTAYDSIPGPSLEATPILLNQNLNQNIDKLKWLRQQEEKNSTLLKRNKDKLKRLGQQGEKNFILNGYLPGSNNHQLHENNSHFTPAEFETAQQQYAPLHAPIVQNVNVAVTNVVLPQNNVYSYLPGLATSISTNEINKTGLKLTVPNHILNIDTFSEQYTIKYCPLPNALLLGIRMSLVGNYYLVNLSEVAIKSLGDNRRLVSKFRTFYRLNSAQKELWDKALKERNLKFDGFFKDVFVEYNEAITILTC